MPRRNRTITFQPEDDVAELLERHTREFPERGQASRSINEALRRHFAAAAVAILEEDVAKLQKRIATLKKK